MSGDPKCTGQCGFCMGECEPDEKPKNRSPYADFDPDNPDICEGCKRPALWCKCP